MDPTHTRLTDAPAGPIARPILLVTAAGVLALILVGAWFLRTDNLASDTRRTAIRTDDLLSTFVASEAREDCIREQTDDFYESQWQHLTRALDALRRDDTAALDLEIDAMLDTSPGGAGESVDARVQRECAPPVTVPG